jgi:hypothetical protein
MEIGDVVLSASVIVVCCSKTGSVEMDGLDPAALSGPNLEVETRNDELRIILSMFLPRTVEYT